MDNQVFTNEFADILENLEEKARTAIESFLETKFNEYNINSQTALGMIDGYLLNRGEDGHSPEIQLFYKPYELFDGFDLGTVGYDSAIEQITGDVIIPEEIADDLQESLEKSSNVINQMAEDIATDPNATPEEKIEGLEELKTIAHERNEALVNEAYDHSSSISEKLTALGYKEEELAEMEKLIFNRNLADNIQKYDDLIRKNNRPELLSKYSAERQERVEMFEEKLGIPYSQEIADKLKDYTDRYNEYSNKIANDTKTVEMLQLANEKSDADIDAITESFVNNDPDKSNEKIEQSKTIKERIAEKCAKDGIGKRQHVRNAQVEKEIYKNEISGRKKDIRDLQKAIQKVLITRSNYASELKKLIAERDAALTRLEDARWGDVPALSVKERKDLKESIRSFDESIDEMQKNIELADKYNRDLRIDVRSQKDEIDSLRFANIKASIKEVTSVLKDGYEKARLGIKNFATNVLNKIDNAHIGMLKWDKAFSKTMENVLKKACDINLAVESKITIKNLDKQSDRIEKIQEMRISQKTYTKSRQDKIDKIEARKTERTAELEALGAEVYGSQSYKQEQPRKIYEAYEVKEEYRQSAVTKAESDKEINADRFGNQAKTINTFDSLDNKCRQAKEMTESRKADKPQSQQKPSPGKEDKNRSDDAGERVR